MGNETVTASLTSVISEVDIDLIHQYLEEIELAQRHKQESQEKLTRMCEDEFPKEFESAGKIKSRRITHGNKYIRKTMIECAWVPARHRTVSSPNSVIPKLSSERKMP